MIRACDKVGLTSKYAKCAILGICGGESGWLCIEEGSYYSKAESLASIFKRSFPGGAAEAQPYVKWQGTKADFFRKIYSPEGNGKLVGHKDPDDGAKYYGRGFNQITGKSLIKQLQDYLKTRGITVDFLGNPQSLINDPATSALATAAFYSLNVKHDMNDPGYFQVALKRTGADANGTGYEKKRKFYEYFLGASVSVDSTNKPAADAQKTYTADEVKDLPPAKQAALLEDRSSNSTIGFSDPEGKYPLRNLVDEPDTNRMARGVQKETAIDFKDSIRTKNIPSANGEDSWEQPLAPFGGMYPYSKIMETESGHLFVLDDTPTNEVVSLYHKSGTFTDIDANGTQVNKIVGDGYTIYDRNGSIYVSGKANLTVGNGVNIYVMGTADIQVDGAATINLKNNADIGVGGDLNMVVGGDMNLQVGGAFKTTAAGITQTSSQWISQQSEAEFTVKSSSTVSTEAEAGITNKSAGDIASQAGGSISNKAGGDVFSDAGGNNNILAAGNINVDGASFHGQEKSTPGGVDVEGTEAIEALALTAPAFTEGRQNQYANALTTPVRPSPPVTVKYAIEEENDANLEKYALNPDQFYDKDADAAGIKPNVAPPPRSGDTGPSLISGSAAADIYQFLQKQLQMAESGHWDETGMYEKGISPRKKVGPDNPNITRIWSDLGFKGATWEDDQTAWCMGFVNWTLKQCGYRYTRNTMALDISTQTSKWNATKVPLSDAQPGDIALWQYGKSNHVNFVYNNKGGKLTFVGGNQKRKGAVGKVSNNPPGGSVSESWPTGYSVSGGDGSLIGVFRPSKT